MLNPAKPMKLDAIDLRILEAVQTDGRITKLRLAEMVGLSPTPCWLRLRKLERAGLITGWQARLEPRRVAPVTSVLMEIELSNHRQADFDRFEKAVLARPEITGCWAVGGGADYYLKVMTRNIDSYQRLVDELLESEIGIARYFSHIVTRTVHEDGPVPIALFAAGADK